MSRPSLHTSPDAWERSWQAELDKKFPIKLSRMPSFMNKTQEVINKAMMTEDGYNVLALNLRRLIDLQNDIRNLCSEKCAEDDFESKWKGAGMLTRKHHYFTAMKRVCDIPDMETQRQWCPDVTLRVFEARVGQGYLDLLLLLSRERPTNEYIHLQHELLDAVFDLPKPWNTSETYTADPKLFMQRNYVQNRTLFISLIVYNVILSFYGRSETYVPDKAGKDRGPSKAVVEAMKAQGASTADLEQIRAETKKTRKELGHECCAACGKFDFQIPEAGRFKVCAKCNKIGRTVRYCSRECQVAHWKRGNPPHKLTCGKLASEHPPPSPSAVDKDTDIPPADSGFVRSPALQHLIKLLTDNPGLDYVFVRPYPHPDHGVQLVNPFGRLMFRVGRDRAFRNGDPQGVRIMWSALVSQAEGIKDFGAEGLRNQLKKEFGLDPENISPPSPQSDPTETES